MICSLECTFCVACSDEHNQLCPNCGGELKPRPIRPTHLLERYPAADVELTPGFAFSLDQALGKLPGSHGEPFAELIRRGSLSIEIFAPQGEDTQQPHAQDELYFVAQGEGTFDNDGTKTDVTRGDLLFVAAGVAHHFEDFSDDFVVWVIFYGPQGGEP